MANNNDKENYKQWFFETIAAFNKDLKELEEDHGNYIAGRPLQHIHIIKPAANTNLDPESGKIASDFFGDITYVELEASYYGDYALNTVEIALEMVKETIQQLQIMDALKDKAQFRKTDSLDIGETKKASEDLKAIASKYLSDAMPRVSSERLMQLFKEFSDIQFQQSHTSTDVASVASKRSPDRLQALLQESRIRSVDLLLQQISNRINIATYAFVTLVRHGSEGSELLSDEFAELAGSIIPKSLQLAREAKQSLSDFAPAVIDETEFQDISVKWAPVVNVFRP